MQTLRAEKRCSSRAEGHGHDRPAVRGDCWDSTGARFGPNMTGTPGKHQPIPAVKSLPAAKLAELKKVAADANYKWKDGVIPRIPRPLNSRR